MRCSYCAGEIADGSRFCGICGRRVAGTEASSSGAGASRRSGGGPAARPSAPQSAQAQAQAQRGPAGSLAAAAAAAGGGGGGMSPGASGASLFELPVSRGARVARVVMVLVLDAALVVAGIVMMLSYIDKRDGVGRKPAASAPSDAGVASSEPRPQVEALPPTVVKPDATTGGAGSGAVSSTGGGGGSAGSSATSGGSGGGSGGATGSGSGSPGAGRRDAGAGSGSGSTDIWGNPIEPGSGSAGSGSGSAGSGSGSGSSTGSGSGSAGEPGSGSGSAGSGSSGPVDPYADAAAAGTEPEPEPTAEEVAAKIGLVVDRHGAQLERCYTQSAKAFTPEQPLQGTVDIQFEVMPTGEARNVRVVGNDTGSDQLADCIASLVGGWAMPATHADGPLEFRWPFRFRPPR